MTTTSRIYIFAIDYSIKRVPRCIHDALPFGRGAIPEYAGTRQRVAQVLIESEDRRPVRILDATGLMTDPGKRVVLSTTVEDLRGMQALAKPWPISRQYRRCEASRG